MLDFIIAPLTSFFSSGFYRRDRSFFAALFYPLYLASILCIAGAITGVSWWKSGGHEEARESAMWLDRHLPRMEWNIYEGLAMQQPWPKLLVHPRFGPVLFLDPTRDKLYNGRWGNARFVLTPQYFVIRTGESFHLIPLRWPYEKNIHAMKQSRWHFVPGDAIVFINSLQAKIENSLPLAYFGFFQALAPVLFIGSIVVCFGLATLWFIPAFILARAFGRHPSFFGLYAKLIYASWPLFVLGLVDVALPAWIGLCAILVAWIVMNQNRAKV